MKTLKLSGTQCSILHRVLIAQRQEHQDMIARHEKSLGEVNELISQLMSRDVKLVAGNVKTKASEQAIARERLGEARRIINADRKVVRE